MRRSEREITDAGALEEILQGADLLFLALGGRPAPYVLPVCFGYEDGVLYVHSALVGTKMDMLRDDPAVGFSACTRMTVTGGPAACAFSAAGRSVVGTGTAKIVEEETGRRRGLDAIMRHYRVAGPYDYAPGSFSRTAVIAIRVDTLHGKRVGE